MTVGASDNWTKTKDMLPPQFAPVYVRGIKVPEQKSYLKGSSFWNVDDFRPLEFPQYWAWPKGYVPPREFTYEDTDKEQDEDQN